MGDSNPTMASEGEPRRGRASSKSNSKSGSLTLEIPPPGVGEQDSTVSGRQQSYDDTRLKSKSGEEPNITEKGGNKVRHTSLETAASPSGGDRVFPVRSVVSVDPTQTPASYTHRSSTSKDRNDYFPSPSAAGSDVASMDSATFSHQRELVRSEDRNLTPQASMEPQSKGPLRFGRRPSVTPGAAPDGRGRVMNFFSDAASEQSSQKTEASNGQDWGSTGNDVPSFDENPSELVTVRFKHTITKEGHAVITGLDGALQSCEDEPIHIPGAVQSFGLLIALQEQDEGQMVVRVVSENSHRIIGYHPQELFKLHSFTDILSEEQVDNLLDHIDFIRDEESDPATNGPEVFTISVKAPAARKSRKLWCAVHVNPVHPELIICEFELDDDKLYPLVPPEEELLDPPEDTLHSTPTQEEITESTLTSSKPLRVLRSARKRKGEAAAMEVFNIMSQVQEQLASAPSLDSFLKILVGVVKELTGFHRVMIYQFDALHNGRVVTELVDPRTSKDLYKGLNFPASDIPKQARELYKINKVRLLYDRDLETARLVCRTAEDLEQPLDLSFSYLRAMSPIHLKYLANMAVRSSMSISINAFGELWGLIACHTYGPSGMRVPFPIRKMCRLVGDTASRNIERLSYASRLQARKLINTVPTESNPSGYIIASSDDLLKLFDADFGLLSIRGETKLLGHIEHTQEALAMLEYLRMRKITSVVTSQDIKMDFPDLRYSPGFDVIAGLLLVPLSVGGSDFIVFFRKPQVREVKWAGNPYEKFFKQGSSSFLEPRKSFKTWSETVIGKCREWTEDQVETAAVLCLVYGKFIEVWRQKELAMQNSQLTKLLLANSAHEVRTPLNAIINYLEIALEGQLDQETRENISKSHSASKSLIYVINDLLDLTKTEEGQDLIKDEIFNLPSTVREAADAFRGDAKRKGLDFQVFENPEFPQTVCGDQRRTRQAIANLIANAVQHTSTGWIRLEMWLQDITDRRSTVEIVVSDSGAGMSTTQLDELFRELEQVSDDESNTGQKSSDGSPATSQKPSRTLGLGLAMVARHVRNAEGQLRLKSEQGKGSRFVIQLPFALPEQGEGISKGAEHPSKSNNGSAGGSRSSLLTPPPVADGERTLIDSASSLKGVVRRNSFEEAASLYSHKSGSSNKSNKSGKSDVDRLIDAISGPLSIDEGESEERGLQRSNSRGSINSRRSVNSSKINAISPVKPTAAVSQRHSIGSERPSRLQRASSYSGDVGRLGSPGRAPPPPGQEYIVDSKTLMSAIRMPDEFSEDNMSGNSSQPGTHQSASRVMFDNPENGQHDAKYLRTLVAEDDPINSKIIRKRLEKSGHEVYHTINGEECARAYADRPTFFDVVLMDMQMPIVDGLTATKRIRSFEHSRTESHLSPRAAANGRVPIFAVSASLLERERNTYIEAGFDGWILKPIDFKRLNVLLTGIVDESVRNSCLYTPGEWEAGGWFRSRQQAIYDANFMTPSKRPGPSRPRSNSTQSEWTPRTAQGSSDSGSATPTPSAHSGHSGRSGRSGRSGTTLEKIPRVCLTDEKKASSVLTPPPEQPEEQEEDDASRTPQQI